MGFENIDDLKESIDKFEKMYDAVRIVEPLNKKIIRITNRCEESNAPCFEFWKRDEFCENCISQRANHEEETIVKVDYDMDVLYMVMATPINIENKKYVMELFKDITDTGIIADINGKSFEEINEIIEKLNKDVVTDELTGVYNRRYLNERLPVDILKVQKDNKDLSAIMIDFDNFKLVNDKYGHAAGDKALKDICNIIISNIRKNQDWVVRFGGDEFLIILPGANKLNSYIIAENIITIIENTKFEFEENIFNATVSMGVYALKSEDNFESFLSNVDKMMYKAKNCGGNCII